MVDRIRFSFIVLRNDKECKDAIYRAINKYNPVVGDYVLVKYRDSGSICKYIIHSLDAKDFDEMVYPLYDTRNDILNDLLDKYVVENLSGKTFQEMVEWVKSILLDAKIDISKYQSGD